MFVGSDLCDNNNNSDLAVKSSMMPMPYFLPDSYVVRICPNIAACKISHGWLNLRLLSDAGAFLKIATRNGWKVMGCTTEILRVGMTSDCRDIESNRSGLGFPRRR